MTITLPPFSGNGDKDEDPQDFINGIRKHFLMKGTLTDASKVEFLEVSLKSRSPAATWFAALSPANKATWAALYTAFLVRWPVKTAPVVTPGEKQRLLETTLLQESDMGKRVMVGGVEEYTHIAWADQIEKMANDIPDTNNLLVSAIRKTLPSVIRKIIGSKDITWLAFCNTVRAITLEEIQDALEEARMATKNQDDIARLTKLQTQNQANSLTNAFQQFTITAPSPTSQLIPRFPPRFAQPTPPTLPQTFAEKPAAERMRDLIKNALPIHPDTPAGRSAYEVQVQAYRNTHGTKNPNEIRPYPLRPGSAPVVSGECWSCGMPPHHPAVCMSSQAPEAETKWRRIAASIQTRARAASAPVNVNVVGLGEATGWSSVQEYHAAIIAEYEFQRSQGNKEGPSI